MDKENKKYIFNLDKLINTNIEKQTIENLVINYKNINNSIFSDNNYINNILYNFTIAKNINNIKNTSLFVNNINIVLNDANFLIKDNENETSIKLKNLNFIYDNKKLKFNAKEILFEFDLISMLPMIQSEIKTDIIKDIFKHKYDYIKIINEIIKEVNVDISNIKGVFYIENKMYYIDLMSRGIKVNIILIMFK